MNARDYLAKQGIALERDEERPNTLEELAWQRARHAGSQRPRSGTPHDWEDWERHHAQLADDAERIVQKYDPAAHRHGDDEPRGGS
ncbi:hypothetical protein [Modicisalibacter radicis]|uniref:hypothetical protein n=1 Tax=Halomonas sp. EAR18 TaxID=2518972 RepID=UPI00109D0BA7|nr:hypothetical protein [Halomonas sp. EAR18]